jgi:hypothetical protein
VLGRCVRPNASEFECRPMSAVERIGYVRTHSVIFILFFYKNIYILKIITTNTQTKIFTNYKHKHTSTPPPNLKCHIAHNVTELTNLGDGSIQV